MMDKTGGPLLDLLGRRATDERPLRVGLIGAGKFGTMFLSQARSLRGLHVLGVADLSLDRARTALARAGWPEAQCGAATAAEARRDLTTWLTEDAEALLQADGLEVVVEATGLPTAGIRHALGAFEQGCHVVMVNVEADALAGPMLARKAAGAGVVYSLAYGDQPALICELVEWARISGFEVMCAGKGTKYLPHYHASTPDTVWDYYGFTPEMVEQGDFNPQMFNSFLDGTKSAIEMAAVANATQLKPQASGLSFPPCGADDLADICRPRQEGGQLERAGTVEVVSSLERDGTPVERDLRWGVYVTFAAPTDYVRRCFAEYGLPTDSSGRYAALYRPYHLIGLELTVSVLRVGLRQEPTGYPIAFCADVVAVAKRDLPTGTVLDGEGGYTVYGKLVPAQESLRRGLLPLGLANDVTLRTAVASGQPVEASAVDLDMAESAARFRRTMESAFASGE